MSRRPFRIPKGSRKAIPQEARVRFWLCIPEGPGVYVAALGDMTKIGYSDTLRTRAKSVISSYRSVTPDKKGAWRDRQLAAYIRCESKQEAQRLEKYLHGLFANVWVERELFAIQGHEAIARIATADPDLPLKDCYRLLDDMIYSVRVRNS